MKYPVVIHKDESSDYGVTVPDLPGCFSAGTSFEEALENAREAILCHLEGCLNDNEAIAEASEILSLRDNPDYRDGVWALVSVDLSELSSKARRVNVTVPESILQQIDHYAQKRGESRSGLLTIAALEYLANHQQ